MLGIVTAASCARTLESHSSGVYRTPREFHYDAFPKFLVLNTNAKYGFECPAPSAEDRLRAVVASDTACNLHHAHIHNQRCSDFPVRNQSGLCPFRGTNGIRSNAGDAHGETWSSPACSQRC